MKTVQLAATVVLVLVVTAPVALTQDTPPAPGMADRNYGQEWSAWSDAQREQYVLGFMAGQLVMCSADADLEEVKREGKNSIFALPTPAPKVLIPIVTSLYTDPANTLIGWPYMIRAARNKASGKNIEVELQRLRRLYARQ